MDVSHTIPTLPTSRGRASQDSIEKLIEKVSWPGAGLKTWHDREQLPMLESFLHREIDNLQQEKRLNIKKNPEGPLQARIFLQGSNADPKRTKKSRAYQVQSKDVNIKVR